MGLSNKLSFEAGSWNPGLHGLSCSPVVPPGLSACKCGPIQCTSHHRAHLVLQPPPCHATSLPWLPMSIPLTSLDECLFLTPWVLNFYTVQCSGICGFFFLICYYPSFCCVKRQSVSTYASILAGSLFVSSNTFNLHFG